MLPEDPVIFDRLGGEIPGLVERGTVVITAYICPVAIQVHIGTIHESETRAAMEHVEVQRGTGTQDIFEGEDVQEAGEADGILMAGFPPMVEPTRPKFGHH